MKYLVFVLGCTCSGKTTFLQYIKEQHPEVFDTIAVGQILRKRFPPDFFQGKGAMPETEPFVREIFDTAVSEFVEGSHSVLLVDGMPRMLGQIDWIEETLDSYDGRISGVSFVWLHAADEVREARGTARDTDPGSLDLFRNRLHGDKTLLFDVLHALLDREYPVIGIDTTCDDSSGLFDEMLKEIVERLPPVEAL